MISNSEDCHSSHQLFSMLRIPTSLAALLLLFPAVAFGGPALVERASAPVSTSTAKLHTLATSKGKLYFGSATDNPELSNTAYVAQLDDSTMFGQTTATNSMKWDATEPNQGQFTFAGADQIANLAQSTGKLLRGKQLFFVRDSIFKLSIWLGHNCVWHNQLPSWVSNSHFTAAQLTSVIQNHCGTLVARYKGRT